MKNRILRKWSFLRLLYLIIGIAIMYQVISMRQWFGVAFGIYFLLLAIFNLGCIAGDCPLSKKGKPSKQ